MVYHDLGLSAQEDWDVLFAPGIWGIINPSFTALKTSDLAVTVSKGYHDRSLDNDYWNEFGGLTGELQYKDSLGRYTGIPNGIEVVTQQRDFLHRWFHDARVLEKNAIRSEKPGLGAGHGRVPGISWEGGQEPLEICQKFHGDRSRA